MSGADTVQSDYHDIAAFSDIETVFDTIAALKAPLTGIPEGEVKERGVLKHHLKRISDIGYDEIEKFMDAITDLFSARVTLERMKEYNSRIADVGNLGKTLDLIQNQYNTLSLNAKIRYLTEALDIMSNNLSDFHSKLALETIMAENQIKFEYLLTSQTIVLEAMNIIKTGLDEIERAQESVKEKLINDVLIFSLYAIVRIEAFRRKKIGMAELRDTLTLLTTINIGAPMWEPLDYSIEEIDV